MATLPASSNRSVFFAVSLPKFIVMSACTLGIYQIYWFYMHWRTVKEREKSDIWPAARTFFSVFSCYALFRRIVDVANSLSIRTIWWPSQMTILYLLATFSNIAIPEKYVGLLFANVLLLLPAQAVANRVNAAASPSADRNSRLQGWNWLAIALGGMAVGLILIDPFLPDLSK